MTDERVEREWSLLLVAKAAAFTVANQRLDAAAASAQAVQRAHRARQKEFESFLDDSMAELNAANEACAAAARDVHSAQVGMLDVAKRLAVVKGQVTP